MGHRREGRERVMPPSPRHPPPSPSMDDDGEGEGGGNGADSRRRSDGLMVWLACTSC